MTKTIRPLRQIIPLLVLVGSQAILMAQSLHDVVISISDRKRVVNQRAQVITYLQNQNNAPAVTDLDLPADAPVDWLGVGTNPTQSAIDSLDIGSRIALLNQAVRVFDGLKFDFFNSSADEFVTASKVGTLQSYENGDFPPLPRATPENYHELLRLLAQRIRTLQLIKWPAAFKSRSSNGVLNVREIITYDYETEENHLEVVGHDGEPLTNPVDWKPTSIGNSDFNLLNSDIHTNVSSSFSSEVKVHGSYSEAPSNEPDFPSPLRHQTLGINATYPVEAEIQAIAPGAVGTPISGMVYLLRRSYWHKFDTGAPPTEYDKNEARYVIAGSSASGAITLFNGAPSLTINGSWAQTKALSANETAKVFLEDGYQYKAAYLLPEDDPGYSDDFSKSYEQRWKIGCIFLAVFKPNFARGVDGVALRTALDNTNDVLARNNADGSLLLHPRPSLLFGIDLGPGLKGGGEGFISTRPMVTGQKTFGEASFFQESDYSPRSINRFDSTYCLKLAGSLSDYRVVYENDRSLRSQNLPQKSQSQPKGGIGWPYSDGNVEQYDTATLSDAWDSPRIKQVAGRDLIADITHNDNHYGGYTVKIYRRPIGNTLPAPGNKIDVLGMPLIRTWSFSSPSGSAAHPTGIEKLSVTGNQNEKYDIQADQVLPDHGDMGFLTLTDDDYWINLPYFTAQKYSWTLRVLQVIGVSESEKSKKEIKIDQSSIDLLESIDGQLLFTLSSKTLNPFTEEFPKDWKITSAGKTIIGSPVMDYFNPASGYGKWPTSLSINYDGIQPNTQTTWDSNGLLSSLTQGPWTTTGTASGNAHTLTHQFNSSTYSTTKIELLDGGNKVKTSTTADGGSSAHTTWTEIEYGTASTGLPGLPHLVKNSDGSGTTYGWNANADGAYSLTLQTGKINGNSVSGGTKVINDINARGQPNKVESFATNGGNLQISGTEFSNYTAWGMPKAGKDYNLNLSSTWNYAANLSRLASHTSPLGLASSFSNYDSLSRPKNVTINGISSENTYNAFSTSSLIAGDAAGTITESRDALGRLTSLETTWNGVTDHLGIIHGTTSNIATRQNQLGTHTATHQKNDGTLTSATSPTLAFGGNQGTALTIENGLFKSTTQIAGQTASYQTTWTDAWGRISAVQTPNGTTDYIHSPPTSTLKRVCINEPTGRKLITESDPYDSAGAITRSGIDVNSNGELGTSDRYVESIAKVSGGKILTTLTLTEDSGLREILRTEWTPEGNITQTTLNGGEETITRTPNYSLKTVTTTSSKGWSKTETFNNLGLTTNSNLSGPGLPAASLTPAWRADGSLEGVTFTTNSETHSATFKNDGTLLTLTAPGKGNILGVHSISGGMETLTVDGATTVRKLDGTEITTSGGDTPNKTETLAVSGGGFQATTDPVVGASTTTDFNSAASPTSKNYAAGAGEGREYLPGGLLEKVTLARGGDLILGYSPDGAKDLTSITWPILPSGPFTIPAIIQSYGHDRAGRVDEIGDNSGARTLVYQKGRLKQTTWTSGPLRAYQIIQGIDPQGRDTGFQLLRDSTPLHSAIRVPNGLSSEVSEVIHGNSKIVINRNTARQVTGFQWGTASGPFVPIVTQNWLRGTAGRILSASNNVSGAPSFNYRGTDNNEATAFDPKGRRLKCATAGGEWSYQYNGGQLASAVHPTLGSFSYQFDGIGRRTDKGGANTTDLLNRTLAWTNSQNKTVKVTAAPAAQVWFNGTPIPNFTGSYSYPVPSPGAQGGWVPWNTLAILPGQGDPGANPDAKAEKSGAVWIPPVSESFTFDPAGNRESSALWNYGWDAKNQLVRARTKNHNHPTTPQGYDITNAFDAESRRFSKKINRFQNGSIVEQTHITFLHDGNDIIYERHQLPSGLTLLERKYVWGPDISGTQGGAGGAGGLLLIIETKGNATTALYPLYDGSGNVVALADSSGNLQAEYAYGPFGETIYARGPKVQSCPFRFATKYYDSETGLYNFGRRFYDSITGQWLSREPLGESESLNLYSYCHNDPVNHVDVLGLAKVAINKASKNLIELALRYGLINDNAGDDDLIDTAVLNSLLQANGASPIILVGADVAVPCTVCHGGSSGGHIDGVSRLFSQVGGQTYSSSGNGDMMRKIGAGAWGNIRALGKDIGNSVAFVEYGIAQPIGEVTGLWDLNHPSMATMPFDADGSRRAGQQQVYPGISGNDLLVTSGGVIADAVLLFAGPEAALQGGKLFAKVPGWSVRAFRGTEEGVFAFPKGYLGGPGAMWERELFPGRAGRFGDLKGLAGDELTAHHMPQAALKFTAYKDGGALVLPQEIHELTRTYLGKGRITARQDAGLGFRSVLYKDILDVRKLTGSQYNAGMLDLLQYYRQNFPELLVKPKSR